MGTYVALTGVLDTTIYIKPETQNVRKLVDASGSNSIAPTVFHSTQVNSGAGSINKAINSALRPATTVIAYNSDGTVLSDTENGVATSYTYNTNGSINTDLRSGVTRTYSYDGSGNLIGIA